MKTPITNAARDAAADYAGKVGSWDALWADKVRSGEQDHLSLVQAFAKAIADERERCAGIAEKTAPGMQWDGLAYSHGRKIATAIRASGGEGGR